jgi:cell division septation protein DedD
MIFGSTLLEVAIGVVFVYLLVSILCSALNELIEAWLKYRARYLEEGIRKLLSDPGLAESFFEHPLIKPLGERPSYIPARTFSLALWNIATSAGAQGEAAAAGVTQNLADIRKFLGSLPDDKYGKIKVSLLTLIDEAGNDLNKARANVEGWYDDAMDRVSGWYKRRTHFILIVIGLVAAFVLNIDTIQITKALLYNDTLRKSVADAAQKYVDENPAPTPAPTAAPAPTQTTAAPTAAASNPTPTPTPEVAAEEQARLAKAKINQVRGELNSLGLPIGWPFKPDIGDNKYKEIGDAKARQLQYAADLDAYNTDPRRWPPDVYGGLLKILGLILTGLAVSQGAPFWFDLLNKFRVIRSTVKPREKSRPEGTKDKKDDRGENEGEGDDGK